MGQPVQRNIVVSAVNLRKGGTLTVLRDCIHYLASRPDFNVTALVHDRRLCEVRDIEYIEIPWSARGWGRRLWCEYVTLKKISEKLPKTDLWLSLHDTTPRVEATRQAVYCHTPFPFMKPRRRDWVMDPKIPLFAHFTKYAYRWNVQKNRYLIVQQQWMREAMAQLLPFDAKRIIVAPPAFQPMVIAGDSRSDPGPERSESLDQRERMTTFLYPATADVHKDFETLCEAARILEGRIGTERFQVCLTVSGKENRYARWLKKHWGDVASIDFHGLMSRDELAAAYGTASCLVFPSRAETWGLPISEFKPTGKPMILADLPYAHETASGAAQVAYFPVSEAAQLADRMQAVVEGHTDDFQPVETPFYEEPFVENWEQLFDLLLT